MDEMWSVFYNTHKRGAFGGRKHHSKFLHYKWQPDCYRWCYRLVNTDSFGDIAPPCLMVLLLIPYCMWLLFLKIRVCSMPNLSSAKLLWHLASNANRFEVGNSICSSLVTASTCTCLFKYFAFVRITAVKWMKYVAFRNSATYYSLLLSLMDNWVGLILHEFFPP